MAEQLKSIFDAQVVRSIASDLRQAYAAFDAASFTRASLAGLQKLELTGRAWQIAEVMHRHLPQPFPQAARVLGAALGPELQGSDELGLTPFRYLPHVFYVAKYGLDDFEPAMALQYELTKRFTAEFSIRAYLERHPEQTYRRLTSWARDRNVHVRRLVSEGTRPRLPWAARLKAFQADPSPVLALLELLKDDPERYVQRSVANNLNDISKDHPQLAVAVCRRWLKGAPEPRRWVVRHALRSLIKAGNRDALALLGFGERAAVSLEAVNFSKKSVRLGGELRFSFALRSIAPHSDQELLVDYAVHFVKANGATRPKVFKLKKLVLAPSDRAELAGRVSFRDLTTRRHYSGRHQIDVLINGVTYPLGAVDVLG